MSTSSGKVRISLACVACKKRKAKCSGGPPPCQSCKASGTKCVIDESLDGRRKASAKRTFDELTYHKTFTQELLAYLRSIDKSNLEHLVDLVKADVPLKEIRATIERKSGITSQEIQAEESLRVLQLNPPSSPSVRRKFGSDPTLESPITPSTAELGSSSEWSARQLDHQQPLKTPLQSIADEEMDDTINQFQRLPSGNVYETLLPFGGESAQEEERDILAAGSAWARRRSVSRPAKAGQEFSRARNLSISNLLQYQRYLQELLSDFTPGDLQSNTNLTDGDRESWHPALRLRFSTPSTGSDEGEHVSAKALLSGRDSPINESDQIRSIGLQAKGKHAAREVVGTKNPDRMRLRLDNDPSAGTDFHLSQILGEGNARSPEQSDRTSIEEQRAPAMNERMATLNVPLYSLLPLTGIDDSPLARSYTSYRDEARTMLGNGISAKELIGTPTVHVDLLFRPRNSTDAHSVCNWATELCATFGRDYTMPWTLAMIATIARLMRWLLIPTEQSYNEMPSIMRPTQHQRFIPHNPVTDLIPIPAIRDALCIRFRDCITPFIGNSTFNWPYSLDDAVVHDVQADTYQLSEQFERYVDDPGNWMISRRLIDTFPEIAGRSDVVFSD